MPTSFIGRSDLPLGLRNNNPGNIRPGDAWQGMTGENDGFVTFQDISWGLRALAKDITSKIGEGYSTIRGMITRYAPPSENDTAAYIQAVSNDTGIDPDQQLAADGTTLHELMRAIMNHENGDQYSALVSDADIDQGISMTGISLPQLAQAASIAIQNPTTPGGMILLVGVGLLLLASRR